jgi:hypothetical protein
MMFFDIVVVILLGSSSYPLFMFVASVAAFMQSYFSIKIKMRRNNEDIGPGRTDWGWLGYVSNEQRLPSEAVNGRSCIFCTFVWET